MYDNGVYVSEYCVINELKSSPSPNSGSYHSEVDSGILSFKNRIAPIFGIGNSTVSLKNNFQDPTMYIVGNFS